MEHEKDIVDLLNEQKQLEQRLSELRSKKPRTAVEDVILEEVERRLGIVLSLIEKY